MEKKQKLKAERIPIIIVGLITIATALAVHFYTIRKVIERTFLN